MKNIYLLLKVASSPWGLIKYMTHKNLYICHIVGEMEEAWLDIIEVISFLLFKLTSFFEWESSLSCFNFKVALVNADVSMKQATVCGDRVCP